MGSINCKGHPSGRRYPPGHLLDGTGAGLIAATTHPRAPAPVSERLLPGSRLRTPPPTGLPGREDGRSLKAEGQAEDSSEAESAQQS